MQFPGKPFTASHQHFLGFRGHSSLSSPSLLTSFVSVRKSHACVSCRLNDGRDLSPGREKPGERKRGEGKERVKARGKDNVWSVDNEMAKAAEKERERGERRKKKGKRVKSVRKRGKGGDMVMHIFVISVILLESGCISEVFYINRMVMLAFFQEPVIRPSWNTFASSVSGIWKGVGAVFSPITAEMQPVDIGNKNENLYDCYTLLRIEAMASPTGGQTCQIQRVINWVSMNPCGENRLLNGGSNSSKGDALLPKFESFDLSTSDVMEEDVMGMEPGLVFFEDGSYSRGPVDVPIAEPDESMYYLNPIFKFEQRKRTQPSELTGSWKVFEVSAMPVYGEETIMEQTNGTPYVYLCTETLKKRSLPENPVHFKEEEMLDMQDVTVLWLPGGVTAYVDVSEDGILCIGVGWYSDEGINLVMERDYGVDGKLNEHCLFSGPYIQSGQPSRMKTQPNRCILPPEIPVVAAEAWGGGGDELVVEVPSGNEEPLGRY
ncbi:hypothetical protein RHGRI_019339 [Rhododendron griersonianum]|uniref:Uncharacterized protein n=1 Tax=Rhododendron griersonianum TaxID=479676 RepID=A0AAV6JJK8_9ERIC|nr:hypothetical protein RHGRI_019339 [Rhododendron griersonianum]